MLINFGASQGYTLFFIPTTFLALILPLVHLSENVVTLISFTFLVGSALIFSELVAKLFPNKDKRVLSLISFSLFLFSPWQNYLSTYNFSASITIFLALCAIYTKSSLFLFLTAFASWPGLIFSLLLSISFSRKKFVSLLILTSILIFLNQKFTVSSLKNSYIYQLRPLRLTEEINEYQKINFLSTNKKFILPPAIRKLGSNKLVLLTNKLVNHTVSFVDFEQLAYPLASYDITHLSGILPKGNLEVIYLWELPLIIFGIYEFINNKFKHKSEILSQTAFSFVPYIFFEKKYLLATAFLLSPFLIFFEVYSFFLILNSKKKALILPIFALLFINMASYYNTFFFRQLEYRTAHPLYYREIASQIKKNKELKNIAVTTRFGPTPLMSAFYLNFDTNKFWFPYLNNQESYKNITFRPFQLTSQGLEKDTLYIGLIGEFLGPGKDLENKTPPNLVILDKTIVNQELVFEYGNSLWTGYVK